MIANSHQLIMLLPLLIVGLTVMIEMLCISYRRNHFINAIIAAIGLSLALLSLWFVAYNEHIDVTFLIRIDNLAILYTGLMLVSSIATIILAYSWLTNYPGNREEFYLLIMIATIGGILLSSANHLTTLFLGIELISLPLFGMVSYEFHEKYSLEAGIKFTLLSSVASSFLLFGIALIYAKAGQLSFITLNKVFNSTIIHPVLLAGLGMMITGLGFKLSLVPFHLWTPDVYQGAPSPVFVFLATIGKIIIFVVVIRLFLYIPVIRIEKIRLILTIISFFSMLFGNLMALSQNNIKRILGYSSITHFGYLLIGLITIQEHIMALETINVYIIGYLFSSLGAFGVISIISSSYNEKDLDSLRFYRGLFWHRPILSLILTIMMLSLAGIPMTLGFISKFYLIAITVNNHLIWLTIAIIISSVIGLFYYLRIIISLYLSPYKHLYYSVPLNWSLKASCTILSIFSLLVLLLGLYPQPLITLIQLVLADLYIIKGENLAFYLPE